MKRAIAAGLVITILAACQGPALGPDMRSVAGVDEGDMLKLRAGPGTGFDILAGLPNGTLVRVRDCERLGSVRWCEVVLDGASGVTGYVSETYLRAM